jgi:ubiquinone/menaquinone biosynthesis C-methylase UbiE
MTAKEAYIPALKYDWLTKFYDFLIQRFFKEREWKIFLIQTFSNKNPQQILDIGTGTATLSIMMKENFPKSSVFGLDGDHKILEIARKKARHQNLDIQLIQGLSYDLPFEDNHFDTVTSSLMIHHLTDEDKIRTFKEVLRVLKPGGEFNIADWGKPNNIFTRLLFYCVQFLDGFVTTNSNVKGLLPELLASCDFTSVQELKRFNTIGGSISIYKALKL